MPETRAARLGLVFFKVQSVNSKPRINARMKTYSGDIRVPVVEGQVLLDERSQDRHLVLGVVVHDLLNEVGLLSLVFVETHLLVRKALVGGLELARGNGSVVRSILAIELDVVAVDGMVRVIDDRVEALGSSAGLALGGIGQVERVAKRAVLEGVFEALCGLTAEDVVKGAVLHDKDDHILNVRLEVVNGAACVRLLAGRDGHGRDGEGKKTEVGAEMHCQGSMGRLKLLLLLLSPFFFYRNSSGLYSWGRDRIPSERRELVPCLPQPRARD